MIYIYIYKKVPLNLLIALFGDQEREREGEKIRINYMQLNIINFHCVLVSWIMDVYISKTSKHL